MFRNWLLLAARLSPVVLGFAALAAPAAAEDVVYLKPRDPSAQPTRLRGEVVDYTGRELLLRSATGREQSIPAGRIERVETTHSAEQAAGDRAFARRDYPRALDQYRRALAAAREPRDWVRRQILAQIVWCQQNLARADQAGEYFLILTSRDPATPDFACIPLAWTDETPPEAIVGKARQWLADAINPAAVLMGASQLLASDHRAAAIEQLKRLTASSDPRVAWLAEAQLWRLEAGSATPKELRQWSEKIEAADTGLRAGAYFLLGSALARHDPEAAALVLLKVPILYPREFQLSAAALLAAGGCLEKVGRTAQAAVLYRELVADYAATAAAGEARHRLERLAPARAARDN